MRGRLGLALQQPHIDPSPSLHSFQSFLQVIRWDGVGAVCSGSDNSSVLQFPQSSRHHFPLPARYPLHPSYHITRISFSLVLLFSFAHSGQADISSPSPLKGNVRSQVTHSTKGRRPISDLSSAFQQVSSVGGAEIGAEATRVRYGEYRISFGFFGTRSRPIIGHHLRTSSANQYIARVSNYLE